MFFNQYYLVPGIGNIETGLYSGNPATDDKGGFCYWHFYGGKGTVIPNFCNHHAYQVNGLVGCNVILIMNPGAMFAEISHLTHITIDTRFSTGTPEGTVHASWGNRLLLPPR